MLAYGGYEPTGSTSTRLGNFYVASAYDRSFRVKIRTQKSRELLAYLLEYREGVSRERIFADLWGDSDGDVTGMFHTRRGEIRKVFESLGAKNPVVHDKGIYRLETDEIVCDYDAFRQAAETFRKNPTPENAQRVVDHYRGVIWTIWKRFGPKAPGCVVRIPFCRRRRPCWKVTGNPASGLKP